VDKLMVYVIPAAVTQRLWRKKNLGRKSVANQFSAGNNDTLHFISLGVLRQRNSVFCPSSYPFHETTNQTKKTELKEGSK
jgi:hypothetical protein